MKKSEMTRAMLDIEKAFNQKFTKGQIEIWHKYLGEYSLSNFERAVTLTIKNSFRFPAIANIISYIPQKTTYRML